MARQPLVLELVAVLSTYPAVLLCGLDSNAYFYTSHNNLYQVYAWSVAVFSCFQHLTACAHIVELADPFAVKKVHNKRLTEERKPEAAAELTEEKKHGDSDKPGIITHSAATDEYEYSEPYCCVRVYHMWWKARGDVFRVLLALSKKLDDRCGLWVHVACRNTLLWCLETSISAALLLSSADTLLCLSSHTSHVVVLIVGAGSLRLCLKWLPVAMAARHAMCTQ